MIVDVTNVAREGGCACGAVRYRLTSDPLFTHCCHCLNCQRQTGSAFVINLLIEADRVETLAAAPEPIDAPRDDGSMQRIFRCPTCQVAVYSEYGRPEVRFVRGGTLDEPWRVAPDVHIFTKSKLSWVTLPESVPAFEVYYDRKALWPADSLERLDALFRPNCPA
ncbi:MAG TPA: GFA family protein [Gaiellaceae bacterium]|nr:GFA family protein [Gaiellaceae bacterium]